jgi:hypothetical protein
MKHGSDRQKALGVSPRPSIPPVQPFHPCGFSSKSKRNKGKNMSQPQPEFEVSDMPLPETQRELELLLEALHALNSALDHYETEALAPAATA